MLAAQYWYIGFKSFNVVHRIHTCTLKVFQRNTLRVHKINTSMEIPVQSTYESIIREQYGNPSTYNFKLMCAKRGLQQFDSEQYGFVRCFMG